MRSLTSANTPPGCNNLSTPSEDLQQGHQRKPDSSRFNKNIRPSSLSPATHRNPATTPTPSPLAGRAASSLSTRTSNNKAGSPLRPDSPAANRKPTVAQLRARTTNNNPASTPTKARTTRTQNTSANTNTGTGTGTVQKKTVAVTATATATAAAAAAAATGPPTSSAPATGPRRITATTTTIGSGATKTSSSSSTAAATTTSNTTSNTANPETTSSNPPPSPTTAANTTTTTTRSSSSRRLQPALSPDLRTPLRNRDQNVLNPSRPAPAARAKPSPTPSPTSSTPASSSASASASSTPTMPPYDKGGSTTSRQPGMPSLTAKGISRAPLTPKVAAKPSPAVTPSGRRPNNNTHNPTLHANAGGARDDVTSAAPMLGSKNNITPRSGSRQSRVDSNNSTPNGTPNPDRNSDWDHQPTFQTEPVRRQVVTFSPAPSTINGRHDAADSKFFYASDAKSSAPAPAPQPKPKTKPPALAAPQRGSTFMYANGSAVERNRPTSPGLGFTPMLAPSLTPSTTPSQSPQLGSTAEPPQSKFFYANGAPNLAPGFRPSSAASGVGSIAGETRKPARLSAGSASALSMAQRPMSPNRPAQPPTSAPLVKSNSQPNPRAQMTSPPPLAPSIHKRKVSVDAVSQVASHVGSRPPSQMGSDAASTDAMIMSRFMASQSPTPSEMPSPTMSSFFPNQPITIASILQAADELSESESEEEDESKDLEELHSPTKSTHGDPLNDMVVNARRERKVQDLEITNASLEAINRSLERQLKKQSAELRRYKRLSRSGRLSVPEAPPSRVPSESATGGLGIENLDLSDLSEEDEAEGGLENLDDSMFESSELSETDSAESPDADPDRDARRRERDEKRLQLDLTKHRELLVDSQKINQSIKRCLNWSEELIKEGKKALEYSIRPMDVELPPRVLQPLYLREDNEEEGRKDDASSAPSSPLDSPKSLTPPLWSKEPQDRDSGIELRGDSADGG
ncbi:hypothetical protein CkaCkLH20_05743 [Colletotrichum karsti]|uniref:Uncharacterized protein n=1 Tax=Colletotrichum karsti TaxID=1095194 RepID=A0A9P6I4Q3_9PEZI|nr:uncharacterized protein CkaCkLH20_05743 [Colletotrichum karsti]KAF9876897.1 hypothetical protein CkaCkLH20_05743 [Colletotrichum karsti]